MKVGNTALNIAVTVVLAGCASTGESPLTFGQANTLGVSLGAGAIDQGADVVVGYKSQNLAIVPVTMGQPGGGTTQVGAVVGSSTDAYSVLGAFANKIDFSAKKQSAGLGTFFATGLASKRLADGFAHKMGDHKVDENCNPKPAPQPAALTDAQIRAALDQAAKAHSAENQRLLDELKRLQGPVKTPVASAQSENGANLRLIYAQYQSLGFSASAASTAQGADLSLGFKDRNVAIIPSLSRNAEGIASPLKSTAGGHSDALSVFGQFDFSGGNNEGTVESSLGKFFSTGGAARRLTDGFAAKLCGEYQAPKSQ